MKNVKPGHEVPVVCIDAGHYGKRNRSPVVPEYYESEMNWKLQNYQKYELEKYGVQVITTRKDEQKDMALITRGKASRGCDLFISNHSNACDTPTVDRPVVIVQLDGRGDALGAKLAACIRETMQTNDPSRVATRKGIHGEYYGVLRGAAKVGTVGMILEHSFHTNPRMARWLLVDDNLKKLAKAEAKVIAEYFGMIGEKNAVNNRLDFAEEYDEEVLGKYRVVSDDGTLNLRAGAGADKPLVETITTGSTVKCYGYHTGDWLYVVSRKGNIGFCHGGYLVKE